MIGKISKGRSFGGLLAYLFNPKEHLLTDRVSDPSLDKEVERRQSQVMPKREAGERSKAGSESSEKAGHEEIDKQRDEHSADRDGAREARGRIIAGNMAGRNARELEREFAALEALRPDVEVVVFHCAIGIPAEDNVDRETKSAIAERFATRMRLDNTMWVAVEHDEHDHSEIHLVASKVNYDGKMLEDSRDYARAEEIIRDLELEFRLRRVRPSRTAMRRCPTQAEMKYFEKTGVVSTRAPTVPCRCRSWPWSDNQGVNRKVRKKRHRGCAIPEREW